MGPSYGPICEALLDKEIEVVSFIYFFKNSKTTLFDTVFF